MDAIRDDAVWVRDRYFVPTSEKTLWVTNLVEFNAAGGLMVFNEDQTQIELRLPAPYKFSIQFSHDEA